MGNIPQGIMTAALASLGLFMALWAVLHRRPRTPRLGIVVVLAVAALLRLYLMAGNAGYEIDMNCFYAWGVRMATNGPAGFYAPDYFCDYPPGYLWLLWLPGKLLDGLNLYPPEAAWRVMVKLVPFVFDLAAVFLIWRVAEKALDNTSALALAGLYALAPAVLMDGAIWGQGDAVVAFGLAAALLLAMKDRWELALPLYIVTVLIKPQALLAGPLGLAALGADIFGCREKRAQTLKRAGIGLAAGLVAAVLALLPFLQGMDAPIAWLVDKYASTMTYYSYATVNALNLQYLLGNNWVPLQGAFGVLGTVLTFGTTLVGPALFLRKRDKTRLPMLGALTFILIYLLGTSVHERYIFPAFLLLIFAYVQRQDWRIPALFCGLGLLFFINSALLLGEDIHLPQGFWAPGAVLSTLYLALGGLAVWTALDKKTRRIPGVMKNAKKRQKPAPPQTTPRLDTRPLPLLLLLALTVAAAAVIFYDLGDKTAPQTMWHADADGAQVVFDTHSDAVYSVLVYNEITREATDFSLAFSSNGTSFTDEFWVATGPGDCFQWKYAAQGVQGRYVRLTAGAGLSLGEVAFRDVDGALLDATVVSGEGADALVDEGGTVPLSPNYRNSMYFDEIYHGRTAYEHLHGIGPYETTHPPLGKVFIMLGVRLFGMTPFGWRFAGAVAGVLMIPAMYALGLVMFRKGWWALLCAFLLAVDTLHLTMARIATIDSFPVLFIILAYAAMFRFAQMNVERDGWKTLVPLGLSGLFIGLAVASKWIGAYAALGLAAIFFYVLARQYRGRRAWLLVLFCVVAFGLVPFAIYYVSYIPHLAPWGGLNFSGFWQAQKTMLDYHAHLEGSHPYASPWYEWPLSLKPLYMYTDFYPANAGEVSAINAFGNLVVWWGGFACLCAVLWAWYAPLAGKKGPRLADDGNLGPGYVLVGFAAQFAPWLLVTRSTFIYHYFASLVFVILATVYVFAWLTENHPKGARVAVGAYTAAALALFVLHYPLASGMAVSRGYADGMNFLQALNLPGWEYAGWLRY